MKVIADACCNHEGNQETMKKMIEAAAEVGCDYIKFQLFDADELNPSYPDYDKWYKQYKQVQLSDDDLNHIASCCFTADIYPLFTAFSLRQAKRLHRLMIDNRYRAMPSIIKIASPDCNNWELIDYCVRNFEHVIISTGMHHGHEIKKLIKRYGYPCRDKITYLFCRSLYPFKEYSPSDIEAIKALRESVNNWGISDHSDNIKTLLAVIDYYNPDMVERHFTLTKTGKQDDTVSSTPEELRLLTSYPYPALSSAELSNRNKYITRWI